MSSMRNAVQRRNHRERAQPLERQKWGILEKHKDYSLRARDYNAKQARFKVLREKAAERNPDEFYFGMMSAKTSRGGQIVADRGNKALSQDAVRLLKTQDTGYLRTMAQVEGNKRRKLEAAFVFGKEGNGDPAVQLLEMGEGRRGRHTVFVESKEEQKRFDPKEYFETELDGLERTYNRPRRTSQSNTESNLEDAEIREDEPADSRRLKRATDKDLYAIKEARAQRKRIQRAQDVRRKMLEITKTRERELIAAEMELELQRAKMGKSSTVGGVTKDGKKWKCRERKR